MKLNLWNNKDFWAGLMLVGMGTAAMSISRKYPFGSALHMGPGFFPTVLGGIIILFGICIMIVGLRSNEKIGRHLSVRAFVLMPFSIISFGLLIDRAGFVPALVALIFLSAASGRSFKFGEVLVLAAGLTVLSVVVFAWGLGLPYSLFVGF